MTKAEWVEKDGMIEVRIEGHSQGEKENGVDIVCAACSALGCALAGIAQKEAGTRVVKAPGRLRITMRANRKTREWARVIMTGYEMLEEKYPGNVKARAWG